MLRFRLLRRRLRLRLLLAVFRALRPARGPRFCASFTREDWAGLVVEVSIPFAFYFIPLVPFAAWVLTISLLMIVAAWKATRVRPAGSTAVG